MPYHVDESTRLSRSTSLSRILFLLTYLLSQLLVFLVLTFLFILYLLLYLLTLLLLVFLSFLIFKILTILSSQLLVSYFFKILRYLPSRSLLLSQPVVLSSKLNESTRKPPLGLPHTESRAFYSECSSGWPWSVGNNNFHFKSPSGIWASRRIPPISPPTDNWGQAGIVPPQQGVYLDELWSQLTMPSVPATHSRFCDRERTLDMIGSLLRTTVRFSFWIRTRMKD